MSDLADIKKKRTLLKSKATRFINFIDTYIPSDETIFELELRIEKLDLLWAKYDNVQNDIDALLPAPEAGEREQFENAFFQIQSVAKRKRARYYEEKRSNAANSDSAMTVSNNSGGFSHARLPIDLCDSSCEIISFRQDSHVMSGRAFLQTPNVPLKEILFLLRVSGVRVFQIRRSITIDLAGFGFLDIASSSFGSIDVEAFLKDIVACLSKLTSKSNQEHRFLATENWQLKFTK